MVFFITSLQFKSLFVSSSIRHIDQFVEREFPRGSALPLPLPIPAENYPKHEN